VSGFYLLAAAIANPANRDNLCDTLHGLVVGKARRLHWRAETRKQQRLIADTLAKAEGVRRLVDAGAPLDPKSGACASHLYGATHHELKDRRVSHVSVERRHTRVNTQDKLNALRASGVLDDSMRGEFVHPDDDPMLWIPDDVTGAIGTLRKHAESSELEALKSRGEEITIAVS
jgi:hypothetical protein